MRSREPKRKCRRRTQTWSFPIDSLACVIKQEELDLLKVTYDIPNIADPRLPNPNDKPSYHFNGCVTYFSIVLRLGLGSVYSLALFAFGCFKPYPKSAKP